MIGITADCPATVRLFDENSYMSTFEAEVIECREYDGKYAVILDKTAFFPEAGGQPADIGTLTLPESNCAADVLDVRQVDDVIVHIIAKPVKLGKIRGEIDFETRYERMRNHSGEHLLSGLAHRHFSCNNVGFHLNDDGMTVDFDRRLTAEQVLSLEDEVNRIIAENPPVAAYFPDAGELAELDYRSKLELSGRVRIVVIGSGGQIYDRCACCAPHLSAAGEVGMLLITDFMNYKGGTRLTVVCGRNAYKQARTAMTNVKRIAAGFSAKASNAAKAVEDFLLRNEAEKAAAAAVCRSYIELRLSGLNQTEGNMIFFEPSLDKNSLRRLVDKAADMCSIAAGFGAEGSSGRPYVIISRMVDLRSIAKSLNEKMGGRGGGSAGMLQGTATAPEEELKNIFLKEDRF
ncbi:MAG: alanyl-tRNA editing protein [Ruminococcus sp.]|nr:alanyl-tRNA editing protein [Ruminococcus sp.]